jgi:hypothetical protein
LNVPIGFALVGDVPAAAGFAPLGEVGYPPVGAVPGGGMMFTLEAFEAGTPLAGLPVNPP